MDLRAGFSQPPVQAISYFRSKGLTPTWSWRDMIAEEHDYAFTVAKMLDTDLLQETKEIFEATLADGGNLATFKRRLIPELVEKGWWGKVAALNPDGEIELVQLGSNWRLETIFRTNMMSAYSVGQWNGIQQDKDLAPWLVYDSVAEDGRNRASHLALDGFVADADDPVWNRLFVPNGYNCRCDILQMDEEELAEAGLQPTDQSAGEYDEELRALLDDSSAEGFDANPGRARGGQLEQAYLEKINAAPPDVAAMMTAPAEVFAAAEESAQQGGSAARSAQKAEADALVDSDLDDLLYLQSVLAGSVLAGEAAVDGVSAERAADVLHEVLSDPSVLDEANERTEPWSFIADELRSRLN